MSTPTRIERIRETLLHAERGSFTGGGRGLRRRPTVNRGAGINTTRTAEHVEQIADVITGPDPDDYALLVETLKERANAGQGLRIRI